MEEKHIYKAEVNQSVALNVPKLPVAMIAAGAGLLALNLFGVSMGALLWPFFIIGPGLFLILPAHGSTEDRQSKLSFLAVPGMLLTTIGSLLFVMNLTNHFEAWAYAWTLLPAAVVAGISYVKRFDLSHRIHESGPKIIRNLAFAFMFLGVVFELFIFETLGPWWPLVLIGMGIYTWWRGNQQTAEQVAA